MFFALCLRAALSLPECSDLDDWLIKCDFGDPDQRIFTVSCPTSGFYAYNCTPVDANLCVNPEFTRTVKCMPTHGTNPATAALLSIFLGILGVDRFYLGYPTIGVFKLITGGFFGVGWYIDMFLIILQILKPARGGVYEFSSSGINLIRLNGNLEL